MKAGDLEPRRSRVSVEADAQDDSYRSVFFAAGQPQPENKFCHNKIRTALYVRGWVTPFIFIAKGVIREEFSKLPNAYFACIGILQYWGETSNTNGIPTVAPALMGVVVLSSVLKLLQDIERYRADSGLNNSKCMRLENGVFVKRKWVDLKVGDFLKVHNRESMPADVVLVSTYEPSPSTPVGACHVETKSLDGETNLKGRSVPRLFTLLCGGSLAEQTRMIASSTFRGKVRALFRTAVARARARRRGARGQFGGRGLRCWLGRRGPGRRAPAALVGRPPSTTGRLRLRHSLVSPLAHHQLHNVLALALMAAGEM